MKIVFLSLSIFFSALAVAQYPKSYSSAEIMNRLQKLKVFGRVLYIAAHPDDENTRLLAYLANERKYRTAYLSLTRGDGGQNLIGDEQGIALGLIRTQELLAARRIDGAEQFFTSAYDFGYSKSPEETLQKWGHDKILADVVYVIRYFRPDVIITRFPTTGEGGHGHHTASAMLAEEAFDAAADSAKFTEQFKLGVEPWKTKRLYWNTFNFGGNNTQREDQLKINVGTYNQLLGKSYGEIAAESRSQHKSQGFGVPSQRGDIIEYFKFIKGQPAIGDIMEGANVEETAAATKDFVGLVDKVIKAFDMNNPAGSAYGIYELNTKAKANNLSIEKKTGINELAYSTLGLHIEATTTAQLNPVSDSLEIAFTVNNRTGSNIDSIVINFGNTNIVFNNLEKNKNVIKKQKFPDATFSETYQPYWLRYPLHEGGRFEMQNEYYTEPYNTPMRATAFLFVKGEKFSKQVPVVYKSTDPVKGEQVQPSLLVNPVFVNLSPSVLLFPNTNNISKEVKLRIQHNTNAIQSLSISIFNGKKALYQFGLDSLHKGDERIVPVVLNSKDFENDSRATITASADAKAFSEAQFTSLQKISYDHIPDVFYQYIDGIKVLKLDLKTIGKNAGYISGAGDKVVEALEQMAYNVKLLHEDDVTDEVLSKLDVVITGVRAYNVHDWLASKYNVLMNYVKSGGKLVVQYNTNSNAGPLKDKIGPYPFTIGRKRVTDENAVVNFVDAANPLLNYPNKISSKDFEGWIQERSIYHAENTDKQYGKVFSMNDAGEKPDDGSLITAKFGKGIFIYTGLVFFRELPAAVPGAYRLFANIIANKKL